VDVIKETLCKPRLPVCFNGRIHFRYGPHTTSSRAVFSYPRTQELRFVQDMTADLSPLSRRTDKSDQAKLYPEFTQRLSIRPTSVESMPESVAREQASNIVRICRSRYFLITEREYLGLGPMTLEVGDIVRVLLGGNLSFILRSRRTTSIVWLGRAMYMDGEAMQGKGEKDFQKFVLV
jgi:hypothetical protein